MTERAGNGSASSAEPITQLVDHVFALAALLTREGDAIAEPSGLTAARWLVLGALQDGPLSPADIARRRGLQRQSVRESVLRLERSGHIARIDGPDRRTFLLQLTPRGQAALDDIEPRRAAWASETSTLVPPATLEAAVAALGTLRHHLTA
jgi:DNA-binding MarR family transcriptional regulator